MPAMAFYFIVADKYYWLEKNPRIMFKGVYANTRLSRPSQRAYWFGFMMRRMIHIPLVLFVKSTLQISVGVFTNLLSMIYIGLKKPMRTVPT